MAVHLDKYVINMKFEACVTARRLRQGCVCVCVCVCVVLVVVGGSRSCSVKGSPGAAKALAGCGITRDTASLRRRERERERERRAGLLTGYMHVQEGGRERGGGVCREREREERLNRAVI